jgi:hypothetical protein
VLAALCRIPQVGDEACSRSRSAAGTGEAFVVDVRFGPGQALTVAVAAVRSFLRQHGCGHDRDQTGDRFCAACAAALVAPRLA